MPASDPLANAPRESNVGVRMVVLVQRLLTLDSAWTQELERRRSSPGTVPPALHALAADLSEGLDELQRDAFELRGYLQGVSDTAFSAAIATVSEQLGPSVRAFGPTPNRSEMTSRTSSIAACDYVIAHSGAEAALIQLDLARLERSEPTTGNFRVTFRCALLFVSIAAAIAATIGIGGPAPFLLTAVAGQFANAVLGWDASQCPVQLPAILSEPEAPPPATPLMPGPSAADLQRQAAPMRTASRSPFGNPNSPHRGQHLAILLLGIVALTCAVAVVLIVLHRATGTTTAATAMGSLGAAAVGGIAGIVTGLPSVGGEGTSAETRVNSSS